MMTAEENDLLCRVEGNAPMGQIMRRHWIAACLSEEVAQPDGAPIKVKGFVRYLLGEGIEKQETDFAAEVAAVSGVKKPDDKPGGPVN